MFILRWLSHIQMGISRTQGVFTLIGIYSFQIGGRREATGSRVGREKLALEKEHFFFPEVVASWGS